MKKIIIRAEKVSKSYQTGRLDTNQKKDVIWALKDVDFDVTEGDIVNLKGHNGAGKSTLLKILCRITSPTHGMISGFGRINCLLEAGTGFYPELTGLENTYLKGAMLGMNQSEISKQMEEIIAFAGIESMLHTPVKGYSTGMQIRLAFSAMIHLRSEILILDEVLAIGDASFQQRCMEKIREVNRVEGKSILIVSHDIGTMERLCNREIHLVNGQIL